MHLLYHDLVRSSESKRIRSPTKFSFNRLALPNLFGTVTQKTIVLFGRTRKPVCKFWDTQFFKIHLTQKLNIPQPIRDLHSPIPSPFHLSPCQDVGAWSYLTLTIKWRSSIPSLQCFLTTRHVRNHWVSHDHKARTDLIYQVGPTRLFNEASLLQI